MVMCVSVSKLNTRVLILVTSCYCNLRIHIKYFEQLQNPSFLIIRSQNDSRQLALNLNHTCVFLLFIASCPRFADKTPFLFLLDLCLVLNNRFHKIVGNCVSPVPFIIGASIIINKTVFSVEVGPQEQYFWGRVAL